MTDRGEMWVWPIPSDGSPVPDRPPALIGHTDNDGLTVAENPRIPMQVRKYEVTLPVSAEALAAATSAADSFRRWMEATPEERLRLIREAEARRAAERRAATPRVALTMDALLTKMSWSREYAEHLVQPYCECWDGPDGWEYCQHAKDEGLTP